MNALDEITDATRYNEPVSKHLMEAARNELIALQMQLESARVIIEYVYGNCSFGEEISKMCVAWLK